MNKLKSSTWLLSSLMAIPLQAAVLGHIDSVTPNQNDGVTISGWACDSGVNQSINVHFYLGYPAGQGPAFKGITANNPSENAVAAACSNSFNQHRMKLDLSNQQWASHAGKTVYAYGISLSGGTNNALNKSGTFTIPAHVPPQNYVKGHIDNVVLNGNNVTISGWACDYGINQSINVHLYAGGPTGSGSYIKSIVANQSSESAVASACGTTFSQHRWSTNLTTSQWQSFSGQSVYAHGISTSGGANSLIGQSGAYNIPSYVWGLSDFNISAGADFTVAAGQAIMIDQSVDVGTLTIAGDLICENSSASYNLDAKKIVVANGGRFICGSESDRFEGQLNIRMKTGLERAIMVPAGGQLMLFGQDNNKGFKRLNSTAVVGSSAITLNEAVNWQVGDSIVISSTGFNMNEAERVTITAISGNKKQISISPALQYQHYGKIQSFSAPNKIWTLDERAYVANLSRNITVSSYQGNYASTQLGAHMMVMNGGEAYIDSVEFIEMGRLGELGRYPFHWHKVGDANGQFIRNSVVRDSFQRCIVVHNTNYATVDNNVCIDHNGHGIFLEEGNERKNVLTNNLVLGSKKIAANKALLISEVQGVASRFPAPSSYWISNPDNTITDNVASGSEGTGFWMAFENTSKCNTGSLGCSVPISTNTLAFDRNVAHSSKVGITWDGAPTGAPLNSDGSNRALQNAHYAPPTKPVFNDLVYYKNSEAGVYFRGKAATFDGNIAADNRWSLFFAYSQQYKNGAVIGKSDNFTHNDLITFGWGSVSAQLGGVLLYDGPFELENVDFLAFPSSAESYNGNDVTPIPFINIGGANRFENKVKGLTFTPEPSKRMYWRTNSNWDDETYSTSIRDLDGSLTGSAGKVVVHDIPFNHHASCSTRSSWQAKVCDYEPVLYTIRNVSQSAGFFDVINPAGIMVTATPSTAGQHHNKFNTIRGSSGFYTMVANSHLLADNSFNMMIQAEGNGVLGPVVKLQGKNCNLSGMTQYSTLSALNSAVNGGYYRDGNNTYFALKTSAKFPTHVNAALSNVYYRSVGFSCF